MKIFSFRKRLCCSAVAFLTLLAVCGNNLHAENSDGSTDNNIGNESTITFTPGTLVAAASSESQPVTDGSEITLTDMGFKIENYILLGWYENATSLNIIVGSTTVENAILAMPNFHRIGSSYQVNGNSTLHAIWAVDYNNDGIPNYGGIFIPPADGVKRAWDKMLEETDDESLLSLRSSSYYPRWNTKYDVPAHNEYVYHTGCWYNVDHENGFDETLICMNPNYSFENRAATSTGDIKVVFKFEGVLKDGCMINGLTDKSIDTVTVIAGDDIRHAIRHIPFKFENVEDGEAILKISLLTASNTTPTYGFLGADITHSSPSVWEKPFKDYYTGEFTDEITIRFNIYNEPIFDVDTNSISQFISPTGYLSRLYPESGTPLKYMMRNINGLGWKLASSPLSSTEQIAVYDNISIYLREMDKTMGYLQSNKNYFLSKDEFYPDHLNEPLSYSFDSCRVWAWDNYIDSLWRTDLEPNILSYPIPNAFSSDPVERFVYHYQNDYWLYTMEWITHEMLIEMSLNNLEFWGNSYPGHPYASDQGDFQHNLVIEKWDQYAEMLANDVPMPDESCRKTFHFKFEEVPNPDVQRYVEIQTIPGVMSTPTANIHHYVSSRKDFTFTLYFSTDEPLKVNATSYYSKEQVELEGTDLGGRAYSYTIRQVTEPWTVTVSTESASGEVGNDNASGRLVWTHENTLYINSDKNTRATIYTLNGMLLKQLNVSPGTTNETLERGIYIVEVDDARYKVVIK